MKRFAPIALLLFLLIYLPARAQKKWEFSFKKQTRTTIPFRLINNLIIIKLKINNSQPLNFIVDTGLKATLLTELSHGDSLTLNFAEEIMLKGLGGERSIRALSTKGNSVRIGSLRGKDQQVLVLMDNIFHLSEKLGMRVHGIIGYELFKDHIVEIDYSGKRLKIFNKNKYKYRKKQRRYSTFPLIWHRYKPYINMHVSMGEIETPISMHMLIDTGSSDAIWIFRETIENNTIPKPNIRTYLGHGLSGEVYGHKARIPTIKLGDHELQRPIASFPDSSELSIALNYKLRNGSIGGEVLKRFNVIMDYPHSKISLKPNNYFSKPFYFNISGIELSNPYPGMPVYVIADIRENSPADKAGLKPGDQIVDLNRKPIYEYELQEIQGVFSKHKNKFVNLTITREGKKQFFRFKLDEVI